MKRTSLILAALMIGLLWACLVETLAAPDKPVAPATTESKGKRVFFTGHSFFILGGYMAKKVDLIAKAAGKEKHELVGWRYSGSRSGAVDKWWEKVEVARPGVGGVSGATEPAHLSPHSDFFSGAPTQKANS